MQYKHPRMKEIAARMDLYDQVISRHAALRAEKPQRAPLDGTLAELQAQIRAKTAKYYEAYAACRQNPLFSGVFDEFCDENAQSSMLEQAQEREQTICELQELCTSLLQFHNAEGLYAAQPAAEEQAKTEDRGAQTEAITEKPLQRVEIIHLMRRLSDSQQMTQKLAEENAQLGEALAKARAEKAAEAKMKPTETKQLQTSAAGADNQAQTASSTIPLPLDEVTPLRSLLQANKQQLAFVQAENERLAGKNKLLQDRNNQLLMNNRELQKAIEYYQKHCKFAELNEQMQQQNRELVEAIQRLKGQIQDMRSSAVQ